MAEFRAAAGSWAGSSVTGSRGPCYQTVRLPGRQLPWRLLPAQGAVVLRGLGEPGAVNRAGPRGRGLEAAHLLPGLASLWPRCPGPQACFPSGSTGLGHMGLGAPGPATAFRGNPLFSPPGQALDTDPPPHQTLGPAGFLGHPQAGDPPISGPSGDSQGLGVRVCDGHCWPNAGPRGLQGWSGALLGHKGVARPAGRRAHKEWLSEGGGLWTDRPKPGPARCRGVDTGHCLLGGPAPPRPGLREGAGRAGPWEWGAAEGRAGACGVLLWLVRLRGRGWGLGVPAHPG